MNVKAGFATVDNSIMKNAALTINNCLPFNDRSDFLISILPATEDKKTGRRLTLSFRLSGQTAGGRTAIEKRSIAKFCSRCFKIN